MNIEVILTSLMIDNQKLGYTRARERANQESSSPKAWHPREHHVSPLPADRRRDRGRVAKV